MVGVQPQEIFYILLFGLILLGPQRLPGVARKLGSWAAELRRAATDLRTGLEAEVGDLSQIRQEITQPVKDIQRDLQTPLNEARSAVEKPIMEMQAVSGSAAAVVALPKSPSPVTPAVPVPDAAPVLRWIGPIPPGAEPAPAAPAPPLRWVGPVPAAGPTAADSAEDLAEIERTGRVLSDDGGQAP